MPLVGLPGVGTIQLAFHGYIMLHGKTKNKEDTHLYSYLAHLYGAGHTTIIH